VRKEAPELLTMTVDEAAARLGIGRNTAYDAAASGQLPTIRIGRRLLVPCAALERLLGGRPSEAKR
jgi:excisionase family DNA binding protein